jgi:hypothetical protein
MEFLLTRRKDEVFATIAAIERFVFVTHTGISLLNLPTNR